MASKSVGLLTIAFGADTKGFEKAMAKAQKKIAKFGSNLKRTGTTLTKSLTLPMLAFGAASVKAFDEQVKAETKLRTALKGNETAFKNLKTQAQALQKTTLFGDEATIEAAAFLAQLGLNEKAIKKLLPLIQDFATAQNMQLGDAAKLVAKSVGSSTNALSRYGITIEGQVGTTERLESATTALTTAFGGTAEAVAGEGIGAWVQLKNALGDVSEEFGAIIVENIEPLKERLTELAEKLKSLTTEQKENIVKWAKMAAVIGPLLIALGTIVTVLLNVAKAIRAVGLALMWLNANPIGAIITAIAAVIGAFVWLIKASSDTAKEVRNYFRVMANSIIMSANGTIDAINKINPFKAIKKFKLLKLEGGDSLDAVTESAEKAGKAVEKLATGVITGGGKGPSGGGKGGGGKGDSDKAKQFQQMKDAYADALNDMNNADKQRYVDGLDNSETYHKNLAENEQAFLEKSKELYEKYGMDVSEIDGQILDNKIANMEATKEHMSILDQAMLSAGQSIGTSLSQGAASFKEFGAGVTSIMRDVIAATISQGIAASVSNALMSTSFLPPFLIPVVAGLAAGLARTAFNTLIPAFADGGIVSGPTLGLMGEYAGAGSNPEVIAPLDKLKSMMGASQQRIEVVGRIAGDDIWLSNEKAGFNRFRAV